MVLLPDDRAGELRVYEVALCGEDIAQAAEASEDVNIPEFSIDPDVTRDSVVQIGDGPQQLSTDIKFYPNTRRAKPGDTVYWTLEIGEGSGLEPPFTIIPEMDNDEMRETSLTSDSRNVVIAHKYASAAVYIPYLTLEDSTGSILTVFTHNVLGVIPELEKTARIGLDLPTLEDPEGDVVKSIQLFEIDQDLLRTDSGRSFLAERFRRYRDDGMNFVMFNCLTLVSGLKDNICMPIYGETDSFFQDTLTIDSLIGLVELARQEGLMTGFRPLIGNTEDWSGVEHFGYAPTSKLLYFSYHVQMKRFFAEVCEAIGVDVFNIDTENIVTTTSSEAIPVIEAVREVFTGVIGDTPVLDDSALQRGVLYPYLDYIHFSHASSFDPTYSADEIEVVFRLLVENEVLPTVNETGKPCLIETFARYEPSYPGFQREAYEGMLRVVQDDLGFITGISFWEDHLRTTTTSIFTPIGRSAGSVLSEYFNSLIPDSRTYSFTHTVQDYRRGMLVEEFENLTVPTSFFIAASGGEASLAVDPTVSYSLGHSLKVTFSNASSNGEFAYFYVGEDLGRPTSWETFDALSLAIRHSGDLDSIIINVYDQDGDRFIIDRGILQGTVPTWETVIAPLRYFVQPGWAEHGDGHMDWSRVVSWAILGRYFNGPSLNNAWIDVVELVSESR